MFHKVVKDLVEIRGKHNQPLRKSASTTNVVVTFGCSNGKIFKQRPMICLFLEDYYENFIFGSKVGNLSEAQKALVLIPVRFQ